MCQVFIRIVLERNNVYDMCRSDRVPIKYKFVCNLFSNQSINSGIQLYIKNVYIVCRGLERINMSLVCSKQSVNTILERKCVCSVSNCETDMVSKPMYFSATSATWSYDIINII